VISVGVVCPPRALLLPSQPHQNWAAWSATNEHAELLLPMRPPTWQAAGKGDPELVSLGPGKIPDGTDFCAARMASVIHLLHFLLAVEPAESRAWLDAVEGPRRADTHFQPLGPGLGTHTVVPDPGRCQTLESAGGNPGGPGNAGRRRQGRMRAADPQAPEASRWGRNESRSLSSCCLPWPRVPGGP
jgi:hypothetical protein